MAHQPAIPATLETLRIPIAGLIPYGANPRHGNVDLIADSLKIHGQYRPIVVRTKSFEVLAGNHTLAAALSLGWTDIAATFVECSDDEAARIVLVDNRANDLATYDDAALLELLESLPSLDGTGFDDLALADLLDSLGRGTVPDFDEQDEQSQLDTTVPKECPSCHFQWRNDAQGNVVPV